MDVDTALYRKIFDNLQTGIVVLRMEKLEDPQSFVIIVLNPAASKETRITLPIEQMLDKRIADVIPGFGPSGLLEQYAGLLERGESVTSVEVAYPGDAVFPKATLISHRYALSRDTIFLEFTNITEKKETEEKLKSTLEELTQVNHYMVDRELKMEELKKEVEQLKAKNAA